MNAASPAPPKPENRREYEDVLRAFQQQGRSLCAYCAAHGISRVTARAAFLGLRRGPVSRGLRREILEAAGLRR